MSICQGGIYLFVRGHMFVNDEANELSISRSILSITIQVRLTLIGGFGHEMLRIGSQAGRIMGYRQWTAY